MKSLSKIASLEPGIFSVAVHEMPQRGGILGGEGHLTTRQNVEQRVGNLRPAELSWKFLPIILYFLFTPTFPRI
jgi:hypothetical protein